MSKISLAGCAALFITAGCGQEEKAPPARFDAEVEVEQCGAKEAPGNLLLKQGFIQNAEWWKCHKPFAGEGSAGFDSVDGSLASVTGSTARLLLHWQGADTLRGRRVVFWYGSDRGDGYYLIRVDSDENPLPVDLSFSSDALGSRYRFNFAIDDGSGSAEEPAIGAIFAVDFDLIKVGSGDIQINLNWDTLVDLDLYVTDPGNNVIFFGAASSPTGGVLDLDSYAACDLENDRGRGNENVYWPAGAAAEGEYAVSVDLFDDCDTFAEGIETHFRVTLILDRGEVSMYEGTFSGGEQVTARPPMREMVSFIYPQVP